ncbi:MAG: glycosyltransferase family 4 protein [Bacteroidia bacterium]|nr:glycosyltransferase family 4 protein [Bacteroidia bacterium]
MSKLIQIIFAKGAKELADRKSILGTIMLSLSQGFADQGYRIRLNEYDFDELKKKVENPDPYSGPTSRSALPIPKYLKAFVRDMMLFRSYESLTQQIGELEKPDYILELYSFGSTIGLQLSKKWGVPLNIIYDSPIRDEYKIFQGFDPPMKGKVHKAEIDTLRHSSGIMAYSNPVKKYITDLAGLETNDHIRIHQNIDFSRFEFDDSPKPEGEIVIGFIGSFLRWHRVDMLVKVFERLKADGYGAKLLLVGSGLEFPAIKDQVDQSPYKGDITMTGFQDGEQLRASKKAMHIGVMGSSNWYGAPNKLFEYGAMGMACVAPRTPTICDIFDEDQIYMFDNHDEEGLYGVLKKYLDEPENIPQKGKELREFITENYGVEKNVEFFLNMLEQKNQEAMESKTS